MLTFGVISWLSKKQQVVTLSITEAKFITTSYACQVIWLKRILEMLHQFLLEHTQIYCDNSSIIKLFRNPVLHRRNKHIDVRYHFLCDLVKDRIIELIFCQSEEQVAYILTKPLKFGTFLKLRDLLGVCFETYLNWCYK